MPDLVQVNRWIDNLNEDFDNLVSPGTKQYLLAHEIAVLNNGEYSYDSSTFGTDGVSLPKSPSWREPDGETNAPIIAYYTDVNGNKSLQIIASEYIPDTDGDNTSKTSWNKSDKYGPWIRNNSNTITAFSIEPTYDYINPTTTAVPSTASSVLVDLSSYTVRTLDTAFTPGSDEWVFIKGEIRDNLSNYEYVSTSSTEYKWQKKIFTPADILSLIHI